MGQEMYDIFKLITTVAFVAVAAYAIGKNIFKKKSDKKD